MQTRHAFTSANVLIIHKILKTFKPDFTLILQRQKQAFGQV